MGYDGVVITDDVNAKALDAVPVGERADRHLEAGGDIVLTGAASDAARCSRPWPPRSPRTTPSPPRSTPSVERVLTLKERMGLLPCSTTKP